MNSLRPELRKLLAMAADRSNGGDTAAPAGFAERTVVAWKSKSREPLLSIALLLINRAAAASIALGVAVLVILFATGLPEVKMNPMSRPYAALLTFAK